MSRRSAHHRRKPGRDRLGHDQPPAKIQVAAHPRRIDRHPGGDRERMRHRTRAKDEALRQRERLGLPRTGCALVVLRHRGQHQRHQCMHAARGGDDVFGGDRVALLRHRARTAAARRVRLENLGHLGLHQERNVERELGEAAAHESQQRDNFGHGVARDMPGQIRHAEAKLVRECLGHRHSVRAERGERSRGASELHDLAAQRRLVEAFDVSG